VKTAHLKARLVAASLLSIVLVICIPDRLEAASTDTEQLLAEAEQLYRRDGPEQALPVFEELSNAFRISGDKQGEARAISYIGEIYWRLGDYQQAGDYLEQALAMMRDEGDRLQQGKTLNVLGLLRWDQGEFEQAQA
jgi:tetratricopeptide (TPR) repeat protein